MDVTRIAQEIARISPAAGREADKLVVEIGRVTKETNEIRDLYAAELERFALELQRALGFPSSGEKYGGYADWDSWWGNLLNHVNTLGEKSHTAGYDLALSRCAHALHRTLGGSEDDPRPGNVLAWWQSLLETAHRNSGESLNAATHDAIITNARATFARDLAEALQIPGDAGRPADPAEWWTILLTNVRELLAGVTELKRADSPLDMAGMQEQLDRISAALDATHTQMIEYQEAYLGAHRSLAKTRRNLRKALADIEFHKDAGKTVTEQLQAVDLALRGQGSALLGVGRFRNETVELAIRLHAELSAARTDGERELNWRQQMEVQRNEADREVTRLHKVIAEANATIDRLTSMKEAMGSAIDERRSESAALGSQAPDQATHCEADVWPGGCDHRQVAEYDSDMGISARRYAECGEPYPCKHAPDGGNHPIQGGQS